MGIANFEKKDVGNEGRRRGNYSPIGKEKS